MTTTEQVHIRAAVAADRDRLGELAAELVRLHHGLDPLRFLPPDGDLPRGYGRWLAREARRVGALVLVAEVDGEVLGYAYATVEERDWNELLDAHGKLHDVFVDPAARRRGVARALVVRACERLGELGRERVVLATAVGNEEAQELFRSLGFRPSMIEMTRNGPRASEDGSPG